MISLRQLQTILYRENLYRRRNWDDIITVTQFIIDENIGSGGLHGYRWMYQKLQENGLRARKEEVRIILQTIDPEAVVLRQKHRLKRRIYDSKGSNYIWHFDSYDKLKPYGICINGCIDGFSRRIIWLNAYSTSSDPKIIGGYFLSAVAQIGCPWIVRADRGTENGKVCVIQRYLRRNEDDDFAGERSFLYGKSNHNQRIECWWGMLRRQCAEFWMAFFENIKINGNFDGGALDKNLILFCFLGVIQDEIDSVAKVWDSHYIRPTKNQHVPYGRPRIMFSMPALYNVGDYSIGIEQHEIDVCRNEVAFRKTIACDEDIFEMCQYIMSEDNLCYPTDAYTALNLYLDLRHKLIDALDN